MDQRSAGNAAPRDPEPPSDRSAGTQAIPDAPTNIHAHRPQMEGGARTHNSKNDLDDAQHPVGIHISVAEDILAIYPTATTAEICERFIMPRTKEEQRMYIDVLRSEDKDNSRQLVGKATCFVSHAW